MLDSGTALQGVDGSRVLSIDAMGGDNGPATVVAGLSLFLKKNPGTQVMLCAAASSRSHRYWATFVS